MNIDLSGKTAIVTGSTGGIGFAIAAGLFGAGATVVVNGRGEAKVTAACARLKPLRPEGILRGFVGDLGTAEGCTALLKAEPDADILVNNLGIFEMQDVLETADADWLRFFETNVMSGVRLSRAYLPGMQGRGWGRVIFISSESALNIPVEMVHYGVTKTAMLGLSRGLAKRMAGTGVTVNAILPGPTLSDGVADMLKDAGKPPAEALKDFVVAHRPSSILRRAATVEEVANLVVYVASLQASATTGAALRVDGGVVDTIA